MSEWPGAKDTRLPIALEVSRAVYGKAHNQRTDYRWLAATPDLLDQLDDLVAAVRIGPIDHSGHAVLWRCLGNGRYAAILCRPSRARDAAGRLTLIERDLLVWRAPPQTHALVGAAALLPVAHALTDELWWAQRALAQWVDPDFVLPLDPLVAAPAVAVHREQLERSLSAGLSALARLGQGLEQACAAMEIPGRVALLEGLQGPLTPEEIAALLLLVPPSAGDRTSIAGWLLSRRATAEDLEGWHVVACDQASPQLRSGYPPIHEHRGVLERVRASFAVSLAPPAELSAALDPEPLPAPSSPPPEPAPEVDLRVLAERIVAGTLSASDPLGELPIGVDVLVRFALNPEVAWLEPGDLPELELVPDALRDEVLELAWAALTRKEESYERDWLRALVLALVPGDEALERLGAFETEVAPPLMLITRLAPTALPAMARHRSWLERMVQMSCEFERQNYLAEIRSWWEEAQGVWGQQPALFALEADRSAQLSLVTELLDAVTQHLHASRRPSEHRGWRELVARVERPSAQDAAVYSELSLALRELAARARE